MSEERKYKSNMDKQMEQAEIIQEQAPQMQAQPQIQAPQIQIPQMMMPEMQMPQMTQMPQFQMPQFQMPAPTPQICCPYLMNMQCPMTHMQPGAGIGNMNGNPYMANPFMNPLMSSSYGDMNNQYMMYNPMTKW